MQTNHTSHLVLDRHEFRDIMKEAKHLIDGAKRLKYNLMHEHSLETYDLWAPYVLDDIPTSQVNSPGYKIAFLQVMSIVLAMKGNDISSFPKVEEKKNIKEENNIINFSSYKSNRNMKNLISMRN